MGRNTTWPVACTQGVPAPYNLPVPPYRFVNDKTVRIGENPNGTTFELTSIVQM